MEIFLHFLAAYLLMGVGFSIAAWLEGSEKQVDEGKPPLKYFSKAALSFVLLWWLFAIYCYRADIKKSIPKVDFQNLSKE